MESAHINEDEAAIYDRQIRLWGLDAQKRMRASNVLVIGANGMTGEAMKNIVLAGVNSVTLMDHTEVTDAHLSSMFLVTPNHIGMKVADVCVEGLQKLNPLVTIKADLNTLDTKSDEFFKQFHVVLMSIADKNQLVRVNNICRASEIKFFCGSVFGFYGYMFADLGVHEYAEQVIVDKKPDESTTSADGPPGPKRPRPDKKPESETVTVKKSCEFVSLEEVLNLQLDGLSRRQMKRISTDFFIIRTLLDFSTEHGRKPSINDKELLTGQLGRTLSALHVDSTIVSGSFVELACVPELCSACAIVGGITGQEILTAVSQQSAPINNHFFFNPESSAGSMEAVHSKAFAPAKEQASSASAVDVLL